MGKTADGIKQDLEKLIAHGINGRTTVSLDTPSTKT